MQNPKVSVIVPVYNAEQYFPECAEALMAQTLKELEIIFVDDGSTDSSGRLCDEYAERDSRIRVIHKSNGGFAAARQTGLDAATGEYVIWADSDDWMDPDMYEKMYAKAKETNADMVYCNFIHVFHHVKKYEKQPYSQYCNHVDLIRWLIEGKLHGSIWIKLFKRSLIDDSMFFLENIDMCEDLLFSVLFLRKAEKIDYIDIFPYHYISTSCSITKKRNDHYFISYLNVLHTLERELNDIVNIKKDLQFMRDVILYNLIVAHREHHFNIRKLMQDENLGYRTLPLINKIPILLYLYTPWILSLFDFLYKFRNRIKG